MKKSELNSYIKENIISILSEDAHDDVDDRDAVKAASAARGKSKKYDLALKGFKEVEKRMKSLARDYSQADEVKKEEIKNQLRKLTSQKAELKALVDKFADEFDVDCVENFEDMYQGQHETGANFAENICEELGYIRDLPPWVAVDWEKTWEDALSNDYVEIDCDMSDYTYGHIFSNNY